MENETVTITLDRDQAITLQRLIHKPNVLATLFATVTNFFSDIAKLKERVAHETEKLAEEGWEISKEFETIEKKLVEFTKN